jgi:hypothetical protein
VCRLGCENWGYVMLCLCTVYAISYKYFHSLRVKDQVKARIEQHDEKHERNHLEFQLQHFRHKKSIDTATKPAWYQKGAMPVKPPSPTNYQHPSPTGGNLASFAFVGALV